VNFVFIVQAQVNNVFATVVLRVLFFVEGCWVKPWRVKVKSVFGLVINFLVQL